MYGNNLYPQMYQQDLMGLRDRIDKQLQQFNNQQNQPAPITQNFQLAPNQNQNGIKYVNGIDDVKKELVFADTLFVNKDYTNLWVKNAVGEIKTYELNEVIEMDEKDRQIASLTAKIEALEKEMKMNESTRYDNANANEPTTVKKSTSLSNDKSSKK